jgi:hypothetical protein
VSLFASGQFPAAADRPVTDAAANQTDALMRTIRLVSAALSGIASAAHAAINPLRGDGDTDLAGHTLLRAMDALEEAVKDVHSYRVAGDLLRICGATT